MDVREKLVELLRNAKAAMKSENLSCDIARNMFVVDFMMANGVTVQEWISVDDRLPESIANRVLVVCERSNGVFYAHYEKPFRRAFKPYDKDFNGRALAKKFNVSPSVISNVVHGNTYAYVK